MGQAPDHTGPRWLLHTHARAGERRDEHCHDPCGQSPTLLSAWISSPGLDVSRPWRSWVRARSQTSQHSLDQASSAPCLRCGRSSSLSAFKRPLSNNQWSLGLSAGWPTILLTSLNFQYWFSLLSPFNSSQCS